MHLVDLHPDDAYYPYAGSVIGLTCVTSGPWTNNGGGWYGGGGTCSDGTYYYFYKVGVELW